MHVCEYALVCLKGTANVCVPPRDSPSCTKLYPLYDMLSDINACNARHFFYVLVVKVDGSAFVECM